MDNLDASGKRYDLTSKINKKMQHTVFKIQKEFCEAIENIEGFSKFSTSNWKTEEGAGVFQILEQEHGVFEKVFVSASVAHGDMSTSTYFVLNKNADVSSLSGKPQFFGAGLSGVAYPKNPNVPVLNFTYRYFELKHDTEDVWWFGGSSDLMPSVLDSVDCQRFHEILKSCCDTYDKSYYRKFKENCDKHYYLKHREECRGIGGIFFENLNYPNKETCFHFVSACMNSIIPSYIPIVCKNKDKTFNDKDRQWQLLLRGRAVEYGLICDKPIEFALMTPGVLHENVLAFLPPLVKWQHGHTPNENSKEYDLLTVLRNPREWV